MNAKEIDGVFHCDCGFSWSRGKNGSHNCADGLREKVQQLAAENVGLKATSDDRRMFIMNGVQLGYIKVPTVETDPALETIRIAVSPQEPTPATDRIVAEAEARGVEKFAKKLESRGRHQDYVAIANAFAKQLREGADK